MRSHGIPNDARRVIALAGTGIAAVLLACVLEIAAILPASTIAWLLLAAIVLWLAAWVAARTR